MRAWILAAVAILGTGHLVARYVGARRAAGCLKPLPIALLAVLVAVDGRPAAYRWLVVAALLCSMAGDVLLLFPKRFVPGLASFLLAHLLYIAAFAPAGGWDARAWSTLLPFALFGGLMLVALWRHLGAERVPVMVYVAAIAVMGWRAAVRAAAPHVPSPSGLLALAGAVSFMGSDSLLAIDRFARHFESADGLVMVTYYAGQTLIALSAVA